MQIQTSNPRLRLFSTAAYQSGPGSVSESVLVSMCYVEFYCPRIDTCIEADKVNGTFCDAAKA